MDANTSICIPFVNEELANSFNNKPHAEKLLSEKYIRDLLGILLQPSCVCNNHDVP